MTYQSEVLADSPRVYWRLEETSGTTATDTSGGGRNGTIAGSPTLGTTGLVGDSNTAITFDGVNDKVSASEGVSLSAFTVEAWIKKSGAPSALQYVAERDDFGASMFSLGVSSTGAPVASYRNTGGSSSTVTGPSSVCDGQTHHLAATWTSGGTFALYVDGVQVASDFAFGGTISAGNVFVVGGFSTGGNWFSGVIDEVAYYTTALTSTRINAHYTAGTPAAPINGSVAGVLSSPTAALSGTATPPPVTGTIAGVLDVPTANLTAGLLLTGTLSGVFDVPVAALTGNTAAPGDVAGTLAGVLALPVASLTGFGTVFGTVDWVISDGAGTLTPHGDLLDLSRALVTNGTYTTDETLAPDVDAMSFYFPGVTLDATKVYTFAVAMESTGGAVLTVTVGGVTYYSSATDPTITRTNAGDLVQATFTIGPGVTGSPTFAVTDAVVWSVQWDGGVVADPAPTPDPDPTLATLESVPLHIVAALVPAPTLVAGRPV